MPRFFAVLRSSFLLLVVVSVGAQEPPERPQNLASLLPEGTLLVVETDDLGGWAVKARESALGRICSDPEMQAFLRPLHESVGKAIQSLTALANPFAAVGLSWNDFGGIDVRRFGFAVVDLSTQWSPLPDLVLTLQLRQGADKAKKILANLQNAGAQFGLAVEAIEIRGRPVSHLQHEGLDLFTSAAGDRVILTTRKTRMEQLYAALDDGNAESLAASPRFRTILRHMEVDRRGLLVYADLERGIEQIVSLLTRGRPPSQAEAARFLAVSGFDQLEALAVADAPLGTGYRSEIAVTFRKKKGLLDLYDTGAADHRFARHAPRNALLYGGEKLDLGRLWDRLAAFAVAVEPRAKEERDRVLAEAKETLGTDLRRDLLGSLGDQWGGYVAAPPGGGLIPDVVVFCSLRDRARAERSVDALVAGLSGLARRERVAVQRRVAEFRGNKIHTLELTHRRDPVPIAPSWAFADDFVVVGLVPQSVKHALMEKPSLESLPLFRQL
ncbi:MAG: hypothetical protein ACE5JG_03805, partial [Planctomycetota bacterium]